jgi:hypothetical protein
MSTPNFLAVPGKTLFMAATNPKAMLVTRTGSKLRKRHVNFPNPHAALDWCLKRTAIFVLLPRQRDIKLN